MFCPNCGCANVEDTRFCTRCGTNLEALTSALSETAGDAQRRLNAWNASLLKKYYTGRRDALTGAFLITGGLVLMSILIAVGMKPIAAFWVLCWLFFWGAIAAANGIGKWVAAAAETRRLAEPVVSRRPLLHGVEARRRRDDEAPRYGIEGNRTDSMEYPGSVTDQTTRKL